MFQNLIKNLTFLNDPVFIEIEETLALQSQNAELKEDSVTGQWIPVVAAALRLLISQVGKKGMQKGWKVARPYVQKALKAPQNRIIDGPGSGGCIIQVRSNKTTIQTRLCTYKTWKTCCSALSCSTKSKRSSCYFLKGRSTLLNLDDTMHLHVGYYENDLDYEGVFLKSLDSGKWLLFFYQESYGKKLEQKYEKYDDFVLLVGEYNIDDEDIEDKGDALFEQFLKENGLIKA